MAGRILRYDAKILGRGFGYDIRGTDGRNGQLTRPFMYRLGRVLGSRLPVGSKVFVTGDARPSSSAFVKEVIKGYRESGIDVVTTPTYLPTGIATWYVVQNEFAGSVVISGSHNPAGQNGAKITEKGKALYGPALASLEEPIRNGNWRNAAPMGTLEVVDVYPKFMSMLDQTFAAYRRPHKILLDAGDGIGGGMAEILTAKGAEVIGINLKPDGTFPTYGMANPSKDTCTDPLKQKVGILNRGVADPAEKFIGMMLDGDGDRVAFVTENGVLFEPEKMAAIYYRNYLRGLRAGNLSDIYGPHMALDVRATSSTTKMVAAEGGIGYYIQAGYPAHREWAGAIIPRIKKDKVTGTSAEASGHFFEPSAFYGPEGERYPAFGSALIDDGFFMGMRMMEILDSSSGTLDALMAEIPSLPFAPEKRAKIDNDKKFAVMEELGSILPKVFADRLLPQKSEPFKFGNLRIQEPDNGLITVDGVLAKMEDGSALVRASNTGAELSFIFEATSWKVLADIMKKTIDTLKPYEGTADLDLEKVIEQYEGIKRKI